MTVQDSLKPCVNPSCDHQVRVGAAYCCNACGDAHEKGYEIHEDGPLGHSEGCLERHAKRGPVARERGSDVPR